MSKTVKKVKIEGVAPKDVTPHYIIQVITKYHEYEAKIFDLNTIESEVQTVIDHIENKTKMRNILCSKNFSYQVWYSIYIGDVFTSSDEVKTFRVYYVDNAGTELNCKVEYKDED